MESQFNLPRLWRGLLVAGISLIVASCLTPEEQTSIVEEHLGPGVVFSPFDINAFPLNKVVCDPFGGGGGTSPQNGIRAKLFYRTSEMPRYYTAQEYVDLTQASGRELFFKDMNVPTRMFDAGFATQTTDVLRNDEGDMLIEYFGLKMNTVIRLGPDDPEGYYEFALLSDDGSILRVKNPDESWSTIISNDGDHPTRMGCSNNKVHMRRNTRLEVEVLYYQGPRFHISNVLMWRPLADETAEVAKDKQCGKQGNEYFFDPNNNSVPLQPYEGLLSRGWKTLTAENFFIPGSDISYRTNYNPCVNGQDPVITGFRVDEVILTDVWFSWRTDIPATAQVAIKNMTTGTTVLTSTDNILRTFHQLHLSGLTPSTTYRVRAVSLSDTLGKAITEEIEFTTP